MFKKTQTLFIFILLYCFSSVPAYAETQDTYLKVLNVRVTTQGQSFEAGFQLNPARTKMKKVTPKPEYAFVIVEFELYFPGKKLDFEKTSQIIFIDSIQNQYSGRSKFNDFWIAGKSTSVSKGYANPDMLNEKYLYIVPFDNIKNSKLFFNGETYSLSSFIHYDKELEKRWWEFWK